MIDIFFDVSFFYEEGNHQIYPYFEETTNSHEVSYYLYLPSPYKYLGITHILNAYPHIYPYSTIN